MKRILCLILLLIFFPVLVLASGGGGGAKGSGTGDMTEATYTTGGKIKNSTGGTGQDSSAWSGIPKVTGPGTWGKTDFGTAGHFYCDAAGSCSFTTDADLFNKPSVAASFSSLTIGATGSITEETNTMTFDDGDGAAVTLQAIRNAIAGIIDWTSDQGATNIHAGNIPDLSATYQPTDADLTAIAALACTENQIIKRNGAGAWICGADDSAGAPTMDSIGDAAGDGTIALGGFKIDWTSTLNTAGAVLKIANTTADLTADVSLLDLVFTDDGDANGFFLRGYDNATDLKWSIGANGAASFGSATITGQTTLGAWKFNAAADAPDAAGESNFDGTDKWTFFGANSEDFFFRVGSAANTVLFGTNSGVDTIDLSAFSITSGAISVSAADGSRKLVMVNNTAANPTGSANEIYFEANILKVNQNGTESSVPIGPTAGQVTFTGPTQARSYALPDADSKTLMATDGNTTGSAATLTTARNINGTAFNGSANISNTFTQCTTIKDPVAASDHHVYRTPVAITITAVHCLASGGTSLTGSLQECDANGANCAGVDGATTMTCTAGSNVNDDGALSNAAIDAGDYLLWDTASVSGTQTELMVCFDYTM